MVLGIMQPYFLPYIGYFQLIHCVDKFVIYDDVNYIKGGWINRNIMPLNGTPFLFTLPLIKASQNKMLNQIDIFNATKEKRKMLKTFERGYKKAPEFSNVMPLIKDIMENDENNLSNFIEYSIMRISAYLDIKAEFIKSSSLEKNKAKGQEQIINICKLMGAKKYVNPTGGQSLYNKKDFEKSNIALFFIKMGEVDFKDKYTSILDILFSYNREHIKRQIEKYDLI